MVVVIFEVEPLPDRHSIYLDAAERLRPLLDDIDGFISVERFESLAQPGKLLSLSCWRDEDAAREWRSAELHRQFQYAGRHSIFTRDPCAARLWHARPRAGAGLTTGAKQRC